MQRWSTGGAWLNRGHCEVGPGASNLQTFLGVNGPVPSGGAGARSPSSPTNPLLDRLAERGRRLLERLLGK